MRKRSRKKKVVAAAQEEGKPSGGFCSLIKFHSLIFDKVRTKNKTMLGKNKEKKSVI